MKILLLKDVRKVGQKGQIVEVAEGYGRNFLVKNGMGRSAIGSVIKNENNKAELKKDSEKKRIENELNILGEKNKEKK